MKLISHERMKSENLQWGKLIEPNEHSEFWHHEIVDSNGQVFTGVVYENGAVETPGAMWDSVDTFERFQARPILHHHIDYVTRTLHWNQDTNELFGEQCYRNVGEARIYRLAGSELLDWILDANEDHLIELPETGHVCISLPAQLKERIAQVAGAERRSFNDWIVSRLSEAVEDERSQASLAQAADRTKRLKELFKQMKLRALTPSS